MSCLNALGCDASASKGILFRNTSQKYMRLCIEYQDTGGVELLFACSSRAVATSVRLTGWCFGAGWLARSGAAVALGRTPLACVYAIARCEVCGVWCRPLFTPQSARRAQPCSRDTAPLCGTYYIHQSQSAAGPGGSAAVCFRPGTAGVQLPRLVVFSRASLATVRCAW